MIHAIIHMKSNLTPLSLSFVEVFRLSLKTDVDTGICNLGSKWCFHLCSSEFLLLLLQVLPHAMLLVKLQ